MYKNFPIKITNKSINDVIEHKVYVSVYYGKVHDNALYDFVNNVRSPINRSTSSICLSLQRMISKI